MVRLVVLGDSLYCSCLAIALRLLLLVKHYDVKLVGVEKSSRPGAVTLCDNRAPRGTTHTYIHTQHRRRRGGGGLFTNGTTRAITIYIFAEASVAYSLRGSARVAVTPTLLAAPLPRTPLVSIHPGVLHPVNGSPRRFGRQLILLVPRNSATSPSPR